MTTDTAHLEAAAAKQTQREDASGDLYTRLSRIEQRFQSPRDRAAAFLEIVCTALGGLSGSLTIAGWRSGFFLKCCSFCFACF